MKTTLTFFLLTALCFSSNFISAQVGLKMVNIGDFKTINGGIIEDCKIGYRTVGELNSDSSNVILWPSWFDGTSESIVKGNLPLWIDSTEFYIIAVDALADGISSSPSNTVNFPEITIRDMVNSQYKLLVNHLNIGHVYTVIGGSMGGMQVFEWMVAYPDFMDKAIPIIGTPKQSSYDIFVWQTQADLINEAGSDEEDTELAMRRAYDICYMNAYTPSFFVRTVNPSEMNRWRVVTYGNMMNSKDYLSQLVAMINHDIYKSVSISLENISNVVKADVIIIVSQQDHLVNTFNSIEFAKQLGYTLIELVGDCGHCAIWCEADKIKEATSIFLDEN